MASDDDPRLVAYAELDRRIGEQAAANIVTWHDIYQAFVKDDITITDEKNLGLARIKEAGADPNWLPLLLAVSSDEELVALAEFCHQMLIGYFRGQKGTQN